MLRRLEVAAALVWITLAGYFLFPGHTYLYSDTQIYLPILERYWDGTVFTRELLAQRPHVAFTIYDEVALALRRLTGWDFHAVLVLQQLLFRALGTLGVFLMATSLGLAQRPALLVAAIFSLGATITGPAVLTVEYEPVPRGFAVPLLLLAVGFVAQGRDLAAGLAASLAFLYHAPTTIPFWVVYFCLALWPTRPAIMTRHILGLAPLLVAVLSMLLLSRIQPGVTEPQPFFGKIEPALEQLQRMRAPYNWIGMWDPYWYRHYVFLWGVALAAFWRLRKDASEDLKFFLVGMPLWGILTLPLSYVLLDRMKWVLIPQIQPARAVLFVTAFAVILGAAAGLKAAAERRLWEAAVWLLIAFAVPAHPRVLQLLLPNLGSPLIRRRLAVVVLLAAVASLAAWSHARLKQWRSAAFLAALLLPFPLLPFVAQVRNYPQLDSPELDELARWARHNTPKEAVFLFPDAGRELYPGIFRAKSLRAVYVDWKAGGQINFLPKLGLEWWRRWQQTLPGGPNALASGRYRNLGIDYLVVRGAAVPAGCPVVFTNQRFTACRL
ncbi:MAG: DUF6798 domain-containing protein [Bryobacterales bacterium]|nr:hypothetical protein [Bryobacteraceae bacterium]MDW8355329.1 DUF6798 domain-containing protein [Bryobacterales bacterium]